MTTKGSKESIIQLGSHRHFPMVERNMKRVSHKRKDEVTPKRTKKGSRRASRK